MGDLPRRIFQIDGIGGGILSVAERPDENRVLLVVGNDKAEAEISLTKADFIKLADLRYGLRFGDAEPQAGVSALKSVA